MIIVVHNTLLTALHEYIIIIIPITSIIILIFFAISII
jgi:hypothetical protein